MEWLKLGRIFDPVVLSDQKLFASLMPMVNILDSVSDLVRIYYSPRDELNRSQLQYIDIDLKNPSKILSSSSRPLISPGKRGTFDDSGVTPGSIVKVGNRILFYYTGWSLTQTVPFNNSIGVAVYDENGEFVRLGDGPILTRTLMEPYSCASPFVMFDKGIYRMWYASMDKWEDTPSGPKHFYDIKYAESEDGITWSRHAHRAITYEGADEYAFGRPCVIKEGGVYRMWYSYRGESYRIGYAESSDGVNWKRMDSEAGIDVSADGWDSEMIEYPFVMRYKGDLWMFYNGNQFGKSGFGLARGK